MYWGWLVVWYRSEVAPTIAVQKLTIELVNVLGCETLNDMISRARERGLIWSTLGRGDQIRYTYWRVPERGPRLRVSCERPAGPGLVRYLQETTWGSFRVKGFCKCTFGCVALFVVGLYIQHLSYGICIPWVTGWLVKGCFLLFWFGTFNVI